MEDIPDVFVLFSVAKIGVRCPAKIVSSGEYGLVFELDLSILAPGRALRLRGKLFWAKTLALPMSQSLAIGERTEVVLIDSVACDSSCYVSFPADPAWLAWNGGTVRQLAQQLAQQIRDSGETALLPILADALEEAGCTDANLLARCRRPEKDDLTWLVTLLATQE